MFFQLPDKIFNFDPFAAVIISLVLFIGLCIGSFAQRYLLGDVKYKSFFIKLILLMISASLMVSADNLIILFITSCLSNILLVLMMIHKSKWKAAKASGVLALKNFLIGALCMAAAFALLHHATNETSIQALPYANYDKKSALLPIALSLVFIASMIQSAIWPFHRWLISSLNSPTPVSAIMHAGLISGGGILLIRFSPLYLQYEYLLNLIFAIGMVTALLGSLWKLMQSDIKRMLACSTMAQMGFMFMQIGLGLFSAAITHLVWHALFKAYLFLASGTAAQEKRFSLDYPPRLTTFMVSIACGLLGTIGFALASGKTIFVTDTTQVLFLVVLISCSQFALSLLSGKTMRNLIMTLILTSIFGLLYGTSVYAISSLLDSMELIKPQPLNNLHMIGMIILSLTWLTTLFAPLSRNTNKKSAWILKSYVTALNASQPAQSTITTHRNQYAYI